jgi:hypothetical protein
VLLSYLPFAFSPSAFLEPASPMPKLVARLRIPAAVRFSRTAIAAGVFRIYRHTADTTKQAMTKKQPQLIPTRLIPIRLIEPWRCTYLRLWREYAVMLRAGNEFPPVQVIRQSSKLHGYSYRLYDGMHRTRAAKHIGRRTIAAHVISDETMTLLCGGDLDDGW